MEFELIEYLRKSGRKPKRDDDGKIIIKGKGTGRQKKGVLFCGVNPNDENSVIMGFSMCNKIDDFDYVNGQYEPGFGLNLAKERAEKWSSYTGFFVQNSWTEEEIEGPDDLVAYVNPDTTCIVEIPPSIFDKLQVFIQRCKRYYQDKNFPEWVKKVENDRPELINSYINYTMEIELDE